jgi:hypothetical protein
VYITAWRCIAGVGIKLYMTTSIAKCWLKP